MTEDGPHQTQIYLVTPGRIALKSFSELLAEILDSVPVACVRLALDTRDQDAITQAADALRGICHSRDVALVISEHYRIVRNLGLDGVHLMGTRDVRAARSELSKDSIVGTFCGSSRHAGMTAGETGANYISFGPVSQSELGTGEVTELDHFKWWSEMIEVPSVAEGGLTLGLCEGLSEYADFFALGDEIWESEMAPKAALRNYAKRLQLI